MTTGWVVASALFTLGALATFQSICVMQRNGQIPLDVPKTVTWACAILWPLVVIAALIQEVSQ